MVMVNDFVLRSMQADVFVNTSIVKTMKNENFKSINKAQK